jgi:hypothetical protein
MTKGMSVGARALMLAATVLGAGMPLGRDVDDGPRELSTEDLEAIERAHGKRRRKHLKHLLNATRRLAGINRARNAAAERVSPRARDPKAGE